MRGDESDDFTQDFVEVACLAPIVGGKRVAVHWIADPHHRVSGFAHRAQQWTQRRLHIVGTHPRNQGESPGNAVGVQGVAERQHVVSRGVRPDLHADWIADASQELHVGTVQLSSALADPQHVRRAVVPLTGEGVLASQCLFVAENQRLVRGVHVNLVERTVAFGVDAACPHECECPLDFCRHLFVALTLGARSNELLVPCMHAIEVGKASLGERAQQVERARRLMVCLNQPLRIGDSRFVMWGGVVHHVTTERRNLTRADLLGVTRAWLGELTGDTSHLHHGYAHGVREHHGHLQDDAELLANIDRRELLETLGAVAGLQQEGVAVGHLTERGQKGACLAREDQRGIRLDLFQCAIERCRIGPLGLLGSR